MIGILAAGFLKRNENSLTAILTVLLTLGLALAADRWLKRRAARGKLSAELDTRLRFLRRLVTLGIALIGGMFALSQFGGLDQLATGVLASSAIVAAVVGFAARQTLANLVAGVMLMVAQPLRIGDQVTIEEHTGVVEDVRLNYTVLLGVDGRRMFIPNERLASSVLRNDTIIDDTARPEVSLWLAPRRPCRRSRTQTLTGSCASPRSRMKARASRSAGSSTAMSARRSNRRCGCAGSRRCGASDCSAERPLRCEVVGPWAGAGPLGPKRWLARIGRRPLGGAGGRAD